MSEIKRIGGATNAVVVQLPERQYPGVVIQFDSLSNLVGLIRCAKENIALNDWGEVRDVLDELEGLLTGYLEAIPKK